MKSNRNILLLALVALLLTVTATAMTIDHTNIGEYFRTGGQMTESKQQPKLSADELLAIESDLYQQLLQDLETNTATDIYSAESDIELLQGFDMNILKQRAAYAGIARRMIDKPELVTKWTCTWCTNGSVPKLTEVVGGIEGKSKLGWYAGYDKTNNVIVLVFKSTGGIENWLLDLDAAMVAYPGCTDCQAHKGFFYGYRDQLRNLVVAAITKLKNSHNTAKLVIAGHSLGAALTTHATVDFFKGVFATVDFHGVEIHHNLVDSSYNTITDESFTQLHAVVHNTSFESAQQKLFSHRLGDEQQVVGTKFDLSFPIYNFGSPRCFNQAGSDWFNSQVGRSNFFRTTHAGDTVTHVPMISLGGRHIGTEVYFPEKGLSMTYRLCSTTDSEDKTCSYKDIAINVLEHRWYGGFDMLGPDQ